MRSERVGQLATVREAARQLGVCQKTILRRIRAGVLPTVEVGRNYLVRLEDATAAVKKEGR